MAAADADASRRHVFARRRQARRGDFRRQATQVRETGGEPQEVDQILSRRMELDDAFGRETGVTGHVSQVGTLLASVLDRDLDQAGRFGCVFGRVGIHPLMNQGFHFGMGA